jgi:hypothetical protein
MDGQRRLVQQVPKLGRAQQGRKGPVAVCDVQLTRLCVVFLVLTSGGNVFLSMSFAALGETQVIETRLEQKAAQGGFLLFGGTVWLRLGGKDKNILIDKWLREGYFFIAL